MNALKETLIGFLFNRSASLVMMPAVAVRRIHACGGGYEFCDFAQNDQNQRVPHVAFAAERVGAVPAVPQNLFPDLGLAGPLEWSSHVLRDQDFSHRFPQCLWETNPTQPRTPFSTLEVY